MSPFKPVLSVVLSQVSPLPLSLPFVLPLQGKAGLPPVWSVVENEPDLSASADVSVECVSLLRV